MFRSTAGRRGTRVGFLSEAYAGLLPEPLGPAFVEALRAGHFEAATNQLRPRVSYGSSRRVLIGDAAGHYHPMTAVGMTLGFGDALALAEGGVFGKFVASRFRATSSPEFLAMGLYEIFADHRAEAVAVRQAIYRGWRANATYRDRTRAYSPAEDRSAVQLGFAFCSTNGAGGCPGDPGAHRNSPGARPAASPRACRPSLVAPAGGSATAQGEGRGPGTRRASP